MRKLLLKLVDLPLVNLVETVEPDPIHMAYLILTLIPSAHSTARSTVSTPSNDPRDRSVMFIAPEGVKGLFRCPFGANDGNERDLYDGVRRRRPDDYN